MANHPACKNSASNAETPQTRRSSQLAFKHKMMALNVVDSK